jgi:hypothetical protein
MVPGKAGGAVRGYGPALEAGRARPPAPEEREVGRLVGTTGGILVKPEGFSAKPSCYRSSGP